MRRRDVLRLGAVGTGIFAVGRARACRRDARRRSRRRRRPVDRLVMTNVVDNIYDVFAKAGKLDSITIERTGSGSAPTPCWPSTASPIISNRSGAASGARSCSTSASPSETCSITTRC